MSALAAEIEAALEPLGLRREERPYVPHATLARVKGRSLNIELPGTGVLGAPIFRVEQAELVRSTLTPRGPIYETVEFFPLDGTEEDYSR